MRIRHILWNLFGLGVPALVALLAIPPLLDRIGTERFGFLALAWGLIGYAGILDLGIGRATNQRISRLRASAGFGDVQDVVATATRISIVTGGVGMLTLILVTLAGAYRLIDGDQVPQAEIRWAMLMLALALPMQSMSATFRGVNEAYLNFKKVSLVRILLGVANFGAPLLVALFTTRIQWLVATLVLSRTLALLAFRYFAFASMSADGATENGKFDRGHASALWKFGGWFAVSSVVNPILIQSDRFVVGAVVSATAVTLYVIPYEAVTKALLFVGAITTVAFPVLTNLVHRDPRAATRMFYSWLAKVTGSMLVVLALLALALPRLLPLWVGDKLDPQSVVIGQILCVGALFYTIGTMYVAMFHARGKTRTTALVGLVEVPLYGAILVLLVRAHGALGAAIAWSLRTAFDAAALSWLGARMCRNEETRSEPQTTPEEL